MPAPSWLLLFWSGSAATCAAALAGSLLGGRERCAWALFPRPRSAGRAAAATVISGALLYPVVYGALFEAVGRSHVVNGVVLGGVHAVAMLVASATAALPPRTRFRIAAMHLVYGTVIALLYVTP